MQPAELCVAGTEKIITTCRNRDNSVKGPTFKELSGMESGGINQTPGFQTHFNYTEETDSHDKGECLKKLQELQVFCKITWRAQQREGLWTCPTTFYITADTRNETQNQPLSDCTFLAKIWAVLWLPAWNIQTS